MLNQTVHIVTTVLSRVIISSLHERSDAFPSAICAFYSEVGTALPHTSQNLVFGLAVIQTLHVSHHRPSFMFLAGFNLSFFCLFLIACRRTERSTGGVIPKKW